MKIRVFLFLFFIMVLVPGKMIGQIEAVGAIFAETNYATTPDNDPVFCFPEGSSMRISYENEVASNISWFQRDGVDNSWDNLFANGVNSIVVEQPGGYMVEIDDGVSQPVTQRFWVFNSQALTNLDAEIVFDDCFEIQLTASSDSVPLIFYDPADDTPGGVEYQRSYDWTTIPALSEKLNGQTVKFDAPYEDLTYLVTVTDRFSNAMEARVDYVSIAVKAVYETEGLKDTVAHERHDEIQGSAPIEIRFNDESLGHVTVTEWTFGDAGRSLERNPLFVFSEAGTDSVYLRVLNRDSGCEDLSEPYVVNVWESELDVPNVFTPNNDGVNDEFRVAYRSLKKFEMLIFNRWGRKVYESTDPTTGWDGKVGNKTGTPGVYFYYIRGEGYNKNEVHKKEGAVHLIRGK